MANLEMGLGIFPIEPPDQILKMARLADELGYANLWFGDSQIIWREVYVNLGAAALETRRAVLGTGVTNPLTRDLTVTASAMATLSELTHGRVAIGIGMGDSSVETMGVRPATLARLSDAIDILRRLLARETVTIGATQVHLDWVKADRIPIFIGASGPRLLQLAGEVADGAIILVGVAPEYLQGAFDCIQRGALAAGRNLEAEGFKRVCWAPCSISEDGKTALDFVKPHVARVLKRPLPFSLSEEDKAVVEEIYKHYEYYQHMAVGAVHGDLVPDRLVTKFAIAGTVEECREQVGRLKETGIDQIAIIPHTPDPRDRMQLVRTFAEDIFPKA